jgi:hypothetical protein
MRDLRAKAGTDTAEASAGNSVLVRSRLRAPVITRVPANQATSILVRETEINTKGILRKIWDSMG